MRTKIYGLYDESGCIRYVGKTMQPIEERLKQPLPLQH